MDIKRFTDGKTKAKIYSNCFKEITPGADEEGMYTYMGDIYVQINKANLNYNWNSLSDDEGRSAIESFLHNIRCFFFYQVERYNYALNELDQVILESSETDQYVYGHSESNIADNGKFGPNNTDQRYFISNPANVVKLKQKGSSVEMELRLRNQF